MSLIGRLYTFLILSRYKPPDGKEALIVVSWYSVPRAFSVRVLVGGESEALIVAGPTWLPWVIFRQLDTMVRRLHAGRFVPPMFDEPRAISRPGADFGPWIERRRRKGAR